MEQLKHAENDACVDFNKLVDTYLYRENRPKKIGKYYPSEIGYCVRKSWYSYKYPQEYEPDLARVFELGNILHDFVARVLKSEKTKDVELLKEEFPFKFNVKKEFEVSGRIDDLLLIKASGQQLLIEVKSCKDVEYVNGPQAHH